MPFIAAEGDTLLLPTPNAARMHLFVIITNPHPVTGNVLIVGLETDDKGCDKTVILHAGEHSFIIRDTSVRYKGARIVSAHDLINLVNNRIALPKDPCSPELLLKIREGLSRSKFTPFEILDFYNDFIWPI